MDTEIFNRHAPECMLSRIRRGEVRRIEATPAGAEIPMRHFTVPMDASYTELSDALRAFLGDVEEGSTLRLVSC